MPFTFADLFAGIGGFHGALGALGGECWFASEIDPLAKQVYEANWRTAAEGDLVPLTEAAMSVPPHDVLAAGFPCQPFSKSGFQRGMNETRGTLFWNICRILQERKPAVILLENVRNLAGPRHEHEWEVIVGALRDLGYRVSG
ncbi:MAG: DNA (cytosine-5-)-methyltransferase, partial [Actinomycetota bacterium]|nr:DNA (cytosine-5-)-methyltransferase [Actinomycetota bacterium]